MSEKDAPREGQGEGGKPKAPPEFPSPQRMALLYAALEEMEAKRSTQAPAA